MRLAKGHGTENDFLLLADPEGSASLGPGTVRHLCDRRTGIGADGLIIAAPARLAGYLTGAQWFMDYRNADGSLAEMCGNGARVFAAFLRDQGLVTGAGPVRIATRGGDRLIWWDGPVGTGETYTVDLGTYELPGGDEASARGFDVGVTLPGLGRRPGLRVAMPNPHTVVPLSSEAELNRLHLEGASFDPTPLAGTNLELVVPLPERTADRGALAMRVTERGVGETRSCGTGCGAAAVAARTWAGPGAPDVWDVIVPGGQVTVRIEGGRVFLSGPAVLVAEVELR